MLPTTKIKTVIYKDETYLSKNGLKEYFLKTIIILTQQLVETPLDEVSLINKIKERMATLETIISLLESPVVDLTDSSQPDNS